MIDRSFIGRTLPPFEVEVEKGALRFFAKATGQADPVYVDTAAAKAAGYPDLPVPPTYLFCLEMAAPNPAALRELLAIDISRVLHGEQQFVYHAMAHAGELLRFEQRIADIYDKKGGALEFVVRETRVSRQTAAAAAVLVAELRAVTVVRNAA
jgi:hypothetical protein